MVWGRYALPGRGKQKKSSSTNSSRTTASAVVPPWFAQSLAGPALEGANTPRRDDGRTRRSLTDRVRSVRNSETIFPGTFRAPFHQKGLSVAYLPGYSSLHRLWVCLIAFSTLHQKQTVVKGFSREKSRDRVEGSPAGFSKGDQEKTVPSSDPLGVLLGGHRHGDDKFFRGGYQVVRERRRKTIKSNPITRANARASRARTLGLMAPKTRSSRG